MESCRAVSDAWRVQLQLGRSLALPVVLDQLQLGGSLALPVVPRACENDQCVVVGADSSVRLPETRPLAQAVLNQLQLGGSLAVPVVPSILADFFPNSLKDLSVGRVLISGKHF